MDVRNDVAIGMISTVLLLSMIIISNQKEPSRGKQIYITCYLIIAIMIMSLLSSIANTHVVVGSPMILYTALTALCITITVNILLYQHYQKLMLTFHVQKRTEELCGGDGPLERETVRYALRGNPLLPNGMRAILSILLFVSVFFSISVFARVYRSAQERFESVFGSIFTIPLIVITIFNVYGIYMLFHPLTYPLKESLNYSKDFDELSKAVNTNVKADSSQGDGKLLHERIVQRILSDKQLNRKEDAAGLFTVMHADEKAGYVRMKADAELLDVQNSHLESSRLSESHEPLQKIREKFGRYFVAFLVCIGYFLFHTMIRLGSLRIIWNALILVVIAGIVGWMGVFPI